MKVLIVALYFPPLNRSGSLRPYYWAKYLAKYGFDVTVFTSRKSEADGKLNLELPIEGFKVIESGRPSRRLRGEKTRRYRVFLKKIRRFTGPVLDYYLMWAYQSLDDAYNIAKNMDICISTFPPYAPHFICHHLKRKLGGLKWIADFRDISQGTHLFKSRGPFRFIENLFEKNLYRNADGLVTVSRDWKDYLRQRFHKPVFLIENGFDPDDFEISWCKEGKDMFEITYTGSIYPGIRDPAPLFMALNLLKKRGVDISKIRLNFIGETEYARYLASKFGLTEIVRVEGVVPRREALRAQCSSSALLFLELEAPEIFGILTGKIYEYLYTCLLCKTPVIGVGITTKMPSGKLIEDTGCGKALGIDVESIAAFIMKMMEGYKMNPDKERIMSYTRENSARKLIEVIHYLDR